MKRSLLFVLVILVVSLFSVSGAQDSLQSDGYSLSWNAIASGGGSASGGSYVLTGTIAQPEAGQLASPPYILVGGFWNDTTAPPTSSQRPIRVPLVLHAR
jgi:hypothetical protein